MEVDTKEFLFYIDASRFDQANWLRYVQCARHFEEQNLIAEQEGIDIMYRAIKVRASDTLRDYVTSCALFRLPYNQ